jgi:FkbM family methyltransferase
MRQLETVYGKVCVPQAEHDLIGRFLAKYGEWSLLEAMFLGTNLSANARILDVGAFVGTFSLGLSRQSSLQFVCAVEANPRIAPLLSSNLERNLHVPYGIEISVVVPPTRSISSGNFQKDNLGSLSFAENSFGTESVTPVGTISLTDLREAYGPFDLVKLDVEGMELELILSDMEALKTEDNLALWVECNENSESLALADAMLGLPHRQLFYFTWPLDNPMNARGVTQPIFPFAYEAGLLSTAIQPRLDVRLEGAGCQVTRIQSKEELRRAMWLTPRWAPAAWWRLEPSQLVAQAGHDVFGEVYDEYLTPEWVADVSQRSIQVKLSTGLARAEQLALERLELIERAEARLQELDVALEQSERRAFERLADTQIERSNTERAERTIAALQVKLLSIIEGRTVIGETGTDR